jgi:hypothetical protein
MKSSRKITSFRRDSGGAASITEKVRGRSRLATGTKVLFACLHGRLRYDNANHIPGEGSDVVSGDEVMTSSRKYVKLRT